MNEILILNILIAAAVVMGVILRVVIQPGYIILPKREGNKIKLNVVGTIATNLIVVLVAYSMNPLLFNSPIDAFLIAYFPGHFIDSYYYKKQGLKDFLSSIIGNLSNNNDNEPPQAVGVPNEVLE